MVLASNESDKNDVSRKDSGRHQTQFRFFRKYRHLEKMILFPAKRFSGFQFQLLQLLQFALCFLWLRLAFLALANDEMRYLFEIFYMYM